MPIKPQRDARMSNGPSELITGALITDLGEFHVDPEELNELILMHGQGCRYRPAMACPCVRPETKQPRAGCPICHGMRWMYPPDLEQEIVALVMNPHPSRRSTPAGEVITDSAVITFPIGIVPGQGDMILPDTEEHVVTQILRRSYQPVDNTAVSERQTAPEQRAPRVNVPAEHLLYPTITRLDALYWLVDDDDAEGGQRAAAGALGRDFTLKGRNIVWVPGHGPATGKAYSVRYRAPAAYVCNPGTPANRSEAENAYPYKCEAQRLDRLGTPDLGGE